MNETISINVTNLKKYYGPIKAIDGLSFTVKAGSIFGMLGPNGAGKTTTIEMIVGLTKRSAGEINILGYSLDQDWEAIKKIIGVQLQSPNLFPRLTVSEILKLFSRFYPQPLQVKTVLHRIGLENKAKEWVKNLSGGQQRRLAIGLAMIGDPKILFLDEPTTGLDPQSRRQLWEVIESLRDEGKTVFLTTHYMEEAERLCDDLVIINQGKLIAQDSPGNLINEFFGESAIEFAVSRLTPAQKGQLEMRFQKNKIRTHPAKNKIILYSQDISTSIREILDFTGQNGMWIEDISIRQASLEDVFLKLTGRGFTA